MDFYILLKIKWFSLLIRSQIIHKLSTSKVDNYEYKTVSICLTMFLISFVAFICRG